AIGEMQGAIDAAARRASPPEAVAKLDAADAGYAKWVRIEGAAGRRGGGTGVFTPIQLDAEIQKQSGSKRSSSYLRGDALMQDLSEAGKQVLPEGIADSGTPERMMLNLGVAG